MYYLSRISAMNDSEVGDPLLTGNGMQKNVANISPKTSKISEISFKFIKIKTISIAF